MASFYANRSFECFFTALANCLLLIKEESLAKRVRNYENELSSDLRMLVYKTGFVTWHLQPKLLEDLTDSEYKGIVYKEMDHELESKFINYTYRAYADKVSEIFIENCLQGNIVNSKPIEYQRPAIITGYSKQGIPDVVVETVDGFLRNDDLTHELPMKKLSAMEIFKNL